MNEYALYKGDDCLAIGTVSEIAQELNLKPETVWYYQTPTYAKRCKGWKAKRLIKLDE